MRVRTAVVLLVMVISLGMISCGGGGGGTSFPELAGTWFGVWEDHPGEAFTVEMTINSKGQVTSVLENGSDIELTGSVSKDSSQVYSVEWDDGSFGGFLIDPTNAHFAYLDEFFFVGIFQKDASALPVFTEPNYEGTWSGYSVWVDTDMNIVNEADTVITVDSQSEVIGTTVAGAFSGTILGWFDKTRGVASGENTAGDIFFHIFLSVDKQFATTFSCPDDYVDFDDCEFGGWSKQ